MRRASDAGAAGLRRAAAAVRRRLFHAHFLRGLDRLWWLPLAGLAGTLALAHGGHALAAVPVAVSLVLWAALAVVLGLRGRPDAYRALAAWDRAAGRAGLYSSAFAFLEEGQAGDPGRALHLERASARVESDLRRLPLDVPLPAAPRRWWVVALLGAALAAPWPRGTPVSPDASGAAGMQAAAQREARRLAAESVLPPHLEELTAEEKARLEQLKRSLEELRRDMARAAAQGPRELLSELEQRARQAEDLARELGAGDSAWASEQMLAEMRQHADTADLAQAIKGRDAGGGAVESRKLAALLDSPELTTEVRQRVDAALDRTLQKATAEDREKMVGQHVGEAQERLSAGEPKPAAAQFAQMAEKFQRMAEREAAQKQLQELAERLRQSGSSIMGQANRGLQKLAGGSSAAEGRTGAMPDMTPLGQLDSTGAASETLPIPGLDQMPQMKPGELPGRVIPGTGQLSKDAKALALIPGTQPSGARLPVAIPIPGTAPGAGLIPGAGSAPGRAGAPGGTLPGAGHVPGTGGGTQPSAAAAQGDITAAALPEGESFVRMVEGQPRSEAAVRSPRRTAAEFLQVEEEAFDEKALPPSRREQVRRYFQSLRERFAD